MSRISSLGVLAALVLGGTAIAEALQLPSESRNAATPGQWVVVAGQAAMVIAGLVGAFGVLARKRWAPAAAAAWGASATIAGSVATVAYGGAPLAAGAAAGAACVLAGALVWWMTRRAVRASLAPPPATTPAAP